MNVETSVLRRYSDGAKKREESLCCPVEYDRDLLTALPREIVDKDYGCGDPTRFVRAGDAVLDLGSGSGKICFMAAQLVGPGGRVIGIDINADMLALARKYQHEMAAKIGGDRVRFLKGCIQNLALDLESLDRYLAENPVRSADDCARLKAWQAQQCAERPLIPDEHVDLVVSNCVLNLVDDAEKTQLLREVFRVLKPGGRVAISDILSDETVPDRLKQDATLWSGCIAGAMQEQTFVQAFAAAGFQAVTVEHWDARPWKVVEGIEFRAVTVTALKGEDRECLDYGHALIYRGPYAEIRDDEGHIFPRGERMAVCERTFRQLTEAGPYAGDFIGIVPQGSRPPKRWCGAPGTRRPAAETKGASHAGGPVGEKCCA